jgi:hypothetical protein
MMTTVIANASGDGNNYAVFNETYSSPTMISVKATASTTSGNQAAGVKNSSNSNPIMAGVIAFGTASGTSTWSCGIHNNGSSPIMKHIRADGSGSSTNYGILNETSSPDMQNVEANGSSYGIYNWASSPKMKEVRATGSVGIENSSSGTVNIDHSTLTGYTNTLVNGSGVTCNVGASKLDGGDVSGTVKCAGVYDGSYTFCGPYCPGDPSGPCP